jgi:heavy metal sensor kinase
LFDTNDLDNFYFVVKSRDGKELARSGNVPTLADYYARFSEPSSLFEPGPPPEAPVNSTDLSAPRTFLQFREIVQAVPLGGSILVGCSIAPELKELRYVALTLAGVGVAILLLGLAGGWWLVSRAIRPIEEISITAVKISAGDLSQRINVAETESELGQLAAVLNSTFARLETAFAQQQQFTADAAHELRTPVSVMLTQTQTALNRERSAVEYRETLEACQRASQRMRKLIESLLARLDAGQETLKRLRFDFSQVAADCVELVQPLANERGVKILSELAPLEITGDSGRLTQVVTNLLTNAIQYNQFGGEVSVALKTQNRLAVLSVSDTGRGISVEDMPHLFQRFFRADPSRTSGNTGLGLAISKAIVEAHSGTVEVSSRPDAGTTFTVRLPTGV